MFGMDNSELALIGQLAVSGACLGAMGIFGGLLRHARRRCRHLSEQLGQACALNESLRRQALYDGLTGLPNRLLLEERISSALTRAEREQGAFALLFLDLDGFKTVNDRYGHAAGDLLLMQIASRLSDSLRHADTIARIGGDEFVVLTEIVSAGDIGIIRDKLHQALSQPFQIGADALCISASLGHARYPDDGSSIDALLARADQGMYHLKRQRQSAVIYATQ
ncbi:GGDEF domain-containing protein [Herbaspirillum sp. C7C2]|uniref:GGDEF domain-containing protein n=1 Tax=Herbaspirillum sp. C7C2 TaxID=2736666 RepID=UPI001F5256EC|nr:GGDEF domain-containing protein [Herbaspirillum sp. C7C2]